MVRGNTLLSNNGAPANEDAFTETGGSLNYPRNYNEAYKNMQTVTDLFGNGVVEEELAIPGQLEWAKPSNFFNEKITSVRQIAESSYLSSGTVLEFTIIVPRGQYIRPAGFELVLPVRFQGPNGEKINLAEWLSVNNFFGHLLETRTMLKDDLETIVHPRPSGSVASHARSIMKDMSSKQLSVIERDMLLDRSHISGENVHHRFERSNPFPTYPHLVSRRRKFANVRTGEEQYEDGTVILRDNLIWRDNKYAIPMTLLSPFFPINSEMSLDMNIKFNIEQDTKKLFENIIRVNDEDQRQNADKRPEFLRAVFYVTPEINYNSYTFSLRQASIHHMGMSQLIGKRTGVQPYYHERNIKIRQKGFSGFLNLDNVGTQFEWVIVSIIPVLSKENGNTYSVYNSENACHILPKLTISNIKDSQGRCISKVYDFFLLLFFIVRITI